MEPPFAGRKQTLAFGTLLFALLLLPWLMRHSRLLSRPGAYLAVPVDPGPYTYLEKQVFDEDKDLDVAFMGSSHMWSAIDAVYVQQQLSKRLGRNASVALLGYRWEGQDLGYLIVKDLLMHRRVKMLVTYMPLDTQTSDFPHNQIFRIFRVGEDSELFSDANFSQKLSLYAGAVLGMPRHLLGAIRPEIAGKSPYDDVLGTRKRELGSGVPFEPYSVTPPSIDAASMIYSEDTKGSFSFLGRALNSYQLNIAKRLAELCRSHHTKLVVLNVPVYQDRRSPRVIERVSWSDILGHDVDLIGVPPGVLFKGLDDSEIQRLYYYDHLNKNGNEMFTRAITPALLRLYESMAGRG